MAYFQIQKTKKESSWIEISNDEAKVSLQSLLNHTAYAAQIHQIIKFLFK